MATNQLPLTKVYLQPGEQLQLHWKGRLGSTGTIVDLHAEGSEMVDGQQPTVVTSDTEEGVGEIKRDGYFTAVFLELETGRFWFNDNAWRQ